MSSSSPASPPPSSPPSSPGPYDRRPPRSRVEVVVRWYSRQSEPVPAELCDVSADGAFLVPTGPFPERVSPGDPVWISITTSSSDVETLSGTIRWRGFHPGHDALGMGIKLDRTSSAAIVKIFPVLREHAHE